MGQQYLVRTPLVFPSTFLILLSCSCFLVTYYFTQRLLPKLAAGRRGSYAASGGLLVSFVKKFGAYMKLHTCLAYAAALKCSDVIDELLALAEHDLRHREVIKLFHRRHALILYEPVSAFLSCLSCHVSRSFLTLAWLQPRQCCLPL